MTNVIRATDKILEKGKFCGRLSTHKLEMKVKEDVFKNFFLTELVFLIREECTFQMTIFSLSVQLVSFMQPDPTREIAMNKNQNYLENS